MFIDKTKLLYEAILEKWEHSDSFPVFGEPFSCLGYGHELHNCFVNSLSNPIGLKPQFFHSGLNSVACIWDNSNSNYEGYTGIVHGGICASLLDTLMANAAFKVSGYAAVTMQAKLKWKRPIHINQKVIGKGVVTKRSGQLLKAKAFLFREDKKILAYSSAYFFLPTENHFKKMIKIESIPDDFSQFFYKK